MTEHQHIEWKSSWRDEYLKWICGFANAQGGRLADRLNEWLHDWDADSLAEPNSGAKPETRI